MELPVPLSIKGHGAARSDPGLEINPVFLDFPVLLLP